MAPGVRADRHPGARSSWTSLHASGRSLLARGEPRLGEVRHHLVVALEEAGGDEEGRAMPRRASRGRAWTWLSGVAVVEGDRHVRTAVARSRRDELVEGDDLAVLLQPRQVLVEERRVQRQVASARVDRVVAEHDPPPGRVGRRQDVPSPRPRRRASGPVAAWSAEPSDAAPRAQLPAAVVRAAPHARGLPSLEAHARQQREHGERGGPVGQAEEVRDPQRPRRPQRVRARSAPAVASA